MDTYKVKVIAVILFLILMATCGCTKTADNDKIEKVEDLNQSKYTVAAVVGAASLTSCS